MTKDTLKKGATAHDASGEPITGTLTIPDQQARTVDLNMPSGNQTITPDNGKVLSKVTVTKPTTMIPENIKKDVNIGGVVGTYEGSSSASGGSETWVLNNELVVPEEAFWEGSIEWEQGFVSNNNTFASITVTDEEGDTYHFCIYYGSTYIATINRTKDLEFDDLCYVSWEDKKYRKITFSTPPTGGLLTWLEANAVKQVADTAVQESKSVSITENGTTTVSPDVPYDAVASVEITANVASSGGGEAVWYDPV